MLNVTVTELPLLPRGTVASVLARSLNVTVSDDEREQLPPFCTVVEKVTESPEHEGFLLDVGMLVVELSASVNLAFAINRAKSASLTTRLCAREAQDLRRPDRD